MRKTFEQQLTFRQTPIDQIKIDMRSRDEIPKFLLGLQYIYRNQGVRQKVFNILKAMIPWNVDSRNARPGMELWKILVMLAIRLNCNWDYDRLPKLGNKERLIWVSMATKKLEHQVKETL